MKTMNLLKKSDRFRNIPVDIKTLPEDVAFGLDELIMFMGQRVTIILYDTGYDISATACKKLYDLPFYIAVDNKLPKYIVEESLIMISAVILDPENLPYELDLGEEAFVVYDEWDFNRFDDMEKVVDKVEETFRKYNESSIDDFIILAGIELLSRPKVALMRRIEAWRDMAQEELDGGVGNGGIILDS